MIGPIGLNVLVRKNIGLLELMEKLETEMDCAGDVPEDREAIIIYGDEDLISDEEESIIREEIEDHVGLIETIVVPAEFIVYDREEEFDVEWDDNDDEEEPAIRDVLEDLIGLIQSVAEVTRMYHK